MSGQKPSTLLGELEELYATPHRVSLEVEGARIDSHLQDIVNFINKVAAIGLPVTLYTPAGVICGNLISRKQYFQEFGAEYQGAFESAFPDQDWSTMAELYTLKANADAGSENDDYHLPPQFIHLNQSSLLDPHGRRVVSGTGTLWRGTLSSVSGFTLGVLTPTN